MDLEFDGNDVLRTIKSASFFPYKSGHLRDDATSGHPISKNCFLIKFNGGSLPEGAPYLQFLEEGTTAHDIPNAFGFADPNSPRFKRLDFGIGGRFDGKFHPGSTKHYHFIQDKVIDTILRYFVVKYNGEVRL